MLIQYVQSKTVSCQTKQNGPKSKSSNLSSQPNRITEIDQSLYGVLYHSPYDMESLSDRLQCNPENMSKRECISKKHSSDCFKCEKCDFCSTYKESLRRHTMNIHSRLEKTDKDFACEQGQKEFTSERGLQMHFALSHWKGRPIRCHFCSKDFGRFSDLQSHIRRVHLREELFKCSDCDYKSCIKQRIVRHYKTIHLKLKSFKCSVCEKSFTDKHYVKAHIEAVHDKKKRFACEECGYAAYSQKIIEKHVKLVHLKIKDFTCKCQFCDYTCSFQEIMLKHVNKVHKKQKRVSCQECGYEAYHRSVLEAHVKRVHLKIKDFGCQFCDYKCSFNYCTSCESTWRLFTKIKREFWKKCILVQATKSIKSLQWISLIPWGVLYSTCTVYTSAYGRYRLLCCVLPKSKSA